MKRFIPILVFVILTVSKGTAQIYPTVSIHDLEFVPLDSLLKCDALGIGAALAGWNLQTSAYYLSHTGNVRDTVEIVGQVIVPPRLIEFTGPGTPGTTGAAVSGPGSGGYNLILRDTGTTGPAWSSIMVRTAAAADTLALYQWGFLGLNPGDIIRLRGYVDEFPASNMASYTEFVPVTQNFILTATMPDGPLEILDNLPVPPPTTVEAGSFMKGTYPGKVMFSTGEPLEDAYVQLTNLTVLGVVNNTNWTFAMVDANGNEISTMDVSPWFTNRAWRSASSTYTLPAVGQVVDTIRGYIATNSGAESARGYRIFPCFPGDIVWGAIHPGLSTHRRNPVALTSSDTASVSIKAYRQTNEAPLKSVLLHYSLNNGPWAVDTMKGAASDSSWLGHIRPQSANTFVKYFCTAVDSAGNSSIYASAAGGSAWADSVQGFFFYTVLDRPLTIHDVQYTPFSNGNTSLLGAVVTINGVVTADTSDLSLTSNGTTPWYIQNDNTPWNGIWVTGIDTLLSPLQKGDSVSVTGTVQEYLNGTTGSVGRVTRIGNASAVSVLAHGKTLPSPVVLTTGAFNALNGSPTAEPYEGMLVRFNNATVTDTAPTYSDATEYTIDDGSGPVIVRAADGKNMYSNVRGDTAYGKTILKLGDKFSFMQGIIYFSYNQYKFVPRGNSDFGTRTTGVVREETVIPAKFALSQNYPNPFNPSTKIEYDIPVSGNVSLKIYNLLGQQVATLVERYDDAGHFVAQFDARQLASGMYIYRLTSPSGALVKKMILLK